MVAYSQAFLYGREIFVSDVTLLWRCYAIHQTVGVYLHCAVYVILEIVFFFHQMVKFHHSSVAVSNSTFWSNHPQRLWSAIWELHYVESGSLQVAHTRRLDWAFFHFNLNWECSAHSTDCACRQAICHTGDLHHMPLNLVFHMGEFTALLEFLLSLLVVYQHYFILLEKVKGRSVQC